LLERLLCIGEGVWEEVLGLVEMEWSGDRAVGAPEPFDIEDFAEEEEFEESNRCLQISSAKHPWWQKQHWEDVRDENTIWGDLSRESQRELTKLKGR